MNGVFYGGKCILCGDTGLCRCKDCGPFVKYCEEYAQQVHTEVNVFHRVEILKVNKLAVNSFIVITTKVQQLVYFVYFQPVAC